ncbi:hypothetical protein [Bacillus cereus]|uniref:hypothetical protein n=1 Tax=Bacillus cereus TaxID=1396 RepID=UPI000B4B38FB|nr:hypothetical protein [Bacillus cereus]
MTNDEITIMNKLVSDFSMSKKYYSSFGIELLFIDSLLGEREELHNMTAPQLIIWYFSEYKDWTFRLKDEMIINKGIKKFCFLCNKYGIKPGFRFKGKTCELKVSFMITKMYFETAKELEHAIKEIVADLNDDKFSLMHMFVSDPYDFYDLIRKEYSTLLNKRFKDSLKPLTDEMEQDLQNFFCELKERINNETLDKVEMNF